LKGIAAHFALQKVLIKVVTKLKVSLVVPVLNEIVSLPVLLESIKRQTVLPDEVLIVDGGSTDSTAGVTKQLMQGDNRFRIIEIEQGTPGKGRNIGVANAVNEWIAFTDAGNRLKHDWLEKLIKAVEKNPDLDVVFGTYELETFSFFNHCTTLAFVTPTRNINGHWWRGPAFVSALMRREVWEKIGGFPDLRASEDMIFLERVEAANFKIGHAPEAIVWWKPPTTIWGLYKRFELYSKINVLAKREKYWHYGLVKHYLLLLPFVVLTAWHSWWWLIVIFGWLFFRTAKNIYIRKEGNGLLWVFNPVRVIAVAFSIVVIDLATYIGWIKAVIYKK
jgi:glycosyltransferase involved in cell wall biosynthesis